MRQEFNSITQYENRIMHGWVLLMSFQGELPAKHSILKFLYKKTMFYGVTEKSFIRICTSAKW